MLTDAEGLENVGALLVPPLVGLSAAAAAIFAL
jgi:hypothetical protein